MKLKLVSLLVAISLTAHAQDHGHLNIGAVGTNQNDGLTFDNAAIFELATNYVKTLVFTNGGRYANLYNGNITFTGLAATEAHFGPEDNAAAPGAQLHAQLVSVDGPPGGVFAFWEAVGSGPAFSLATGATGTNTWRVSENDGSPGSDPYGHIHGRRFTASLPGIYTVGFRAFDFSTNGVGGGPIHTPTPLIKIYFQAGVNIKSIEPDLDQTQVTFAAPIGRTWVLETSTSLTTNATWDTISGLIPGDDYFHEITHDEPVGGIRYYRAKGL